MTIRELRAELKDDNNYQRYIGIRDTAARALPYDKLCDELETIMKVRRVRQYATSNLQPRELLEVSMDETSHRARASEILIVAKRSRGSLGAVLDGVWTAVAVDYDECLRDMKTKAERDAAVTSCFRKGYELLGNIDSLVDLCECLIKDIDQSSFSLSRAASLFELIIRTEKLINVEI